MDRFKIFENTHLLREESKLYVCWRENHNGSVQDRIEKKILQTFDYS